MSGEIHAVHWDFDGEQWQIHDLGALPGMTNSVTHDTAFEEVHSFMVGESFVKPVMPKATLWIMNELLEIFDLNNLLMNPIPDFVLQSAQAYDALGRIAGYGMMMGGATGTESNAFALIPTEITSAEEPSGTRPHLTVNAHPNPGATQFQIAVHLPVPAQARLTVYDPSGRHVATLLDGAVGAGERVVTWNGQNDSGMRLPSGAYFLKLESTQGVATEKILLMR
jgi:hypothetical protein